MRKVSKETVQAFKRKERKKVGNTFTRDGYLMLHGNLIAEHDAGMLTIYDAGWQTPTTKERLNAVLQGFGIPVRLYQEKGMWFTWNYQTQIKGLWEGKETFKIEF